MKPVGPLPSSQQPNTGPCPEPTKLNKGNVHTLYCHSDYNDYNDQRNSESNGYKDNTITLTGTSCITQNITSTMIRIYSKHYVSYKLEGFFYNTTQVPKEEEAKPLEEK